MTRSVDARITAIEKLLGTTERCAYSLAQLIYLAMDRDPGEPEAILKDGELSVGEWLVLGAHRYPAAASLG